MGTAFPLGKHEREKEIGLYFWKLCLLYYSFPEMDCLVHASPYEDVQLRGKQAMLIVKIILGNIPPKITN